MLTMTQPVKPPTTDSDMLAIKETPIRSTKGISLRGGSKATPEQIDAAAKDFESQFISQMMATMFSTVDKEESLAGSDAEDMYQSMLQNEYGKIITRTGGIGVADQVKQIMIQQQEVTR
jgi:peptidoglycan hydrolase FlgJ